MLLLLVRMLLCRVLTGLLGLQDRKATGVLDKRDLRVDMAFKDRLEFPGHQVHTQALDETSPRSARLA